MSKKDDWDISNVPNLSDPDVMAKLLRGASEKDIARFALFFPDAVVEAVAKRPTQSKG